ncbi:UNVERIFIED_CONTAM: hypothetical protein K2H54_062448 [Gekko kuhli]
MRLGPQVSVAGRYASLGLDKLEEKLPILHQRAGRVISEMQKLVLSKGAGAKEAVSKAVQSGKEMEVDTSIAKRALSGAEARLGKADELQDHRLPMMGGELVELVESAAPAGADRVPEDPGHFEGQEKLYQTESQTLGMSSHVTDWLTTVFQEPDCQQPRPPRQPCMQQAGHSTEELQAYSATAQSFRGLSSITLSRGQEKTLKAQDYAEGVLQHVASNTPLSRLAGPLAPGLDKPGDDAEHTKPNDREGKALKAPEQKGNVILSFQCLSGWNLGSGKYLTLDLHMLEE